ncbi:hypothetical protein ACO0LC_09765 [Undibacterium sp. JH2W]|uniref:hypothetical protein n=1 Tax=Undibacterium sp. JH2W TaxID=3413037 RepID=UPI003BF343CD
MDTLLGNTQGRARIGLLNQIERRDSQSTPNGLQLALQLMQSPNAKTAQGIIETLHKMQNPEAKKFEKLLSAAQGNPEILKKMAESVIQQLSGDI